MSLSPRRCCPRDGWTRSPADRRQACRSKSAAARASLARKAAFAEASLVTQRRPTERYLVRRAPARLAAGPQPVRRPGGANLGAERDQLREVDHRGHVLELGDPDEPVRVQVVPEEERRVAVSRREEPRTPVVEEVRLVDRLEAERKPLLGERREHGL